MTNRIDQKFKDLKEAKKKAFIAFVTAGDPSLKKTEELVYAFEKAGVDIVELGVPFSDPMADGPTIQAASQRALDKGTTLEKVLELVAKIRKRSDVPIALMMYYNHVFNYGEEKFIKRCKAVGVDGLIIPDLPPEEGASLAKFASASNVSIVYFVSPTTSEERIKKIVKAATGFIYYVSVAGVTGARSTVGKSYVHQINLVKKYTSKPVCVGFGVSSKEQAQKISKSCEGVIVGSAIINQLQKYANDKDLVVKTARFVASMAKGVH
ncbi:MAG: tryptophan synthase alpha chain [Candidatus Omnitrophota bacterium]|jgi:tryptophan synthase alpha chain